jgi:hypothetical protein
MDLIERDGGAKRIKCCILAETMELDIELRACENVRCLTLEVQKSKAYK